jgi:hypothetical protein
MVPWQQQSDFDTSYLVGGNDHVQHLASLILQIESRHQNLATREAAKPKEASDRAQPDPNRDAKVRTEGRGRRKERTGQRQLLLLLKLLLKRCLRRWEQGKEESPEAMAAAARRVANAASTAGIVSSPGARNALCLEIQLG